MEIVVCLKQVPETGDVEVDSERGTLRREGVDSRTNLYDLHALELAVQIKERYGGQITVLSMGPPQATTTILEAYALGADRGILLSDRRFAGADTLATAFTLAQALRRLGSYQLVLTGMQTSDGDTAQVGPALAEFLGIAHVSYVKELMDCDAGEVMIRADMSDAVETVRVGLPCLLTCTKEVAYPRLPSYRLKKATRERAIDVWSYDDIRPSKGLELFGLDGSPTRVERIFPPTFTRQQEVWEGDGKVLAGRLVEKLEELRML